jgi:hypothetical protein
MATTNDGRQQQMTHDKRVRQTTNDERRRPGKCFFLLSYDIHLLTAFYYVFTRYCMLTADSLRQVTTPRHHCTETTTTSTTNESERQGVRGDGHDEREGYDEQRRPKTRRLTCLGPLVCFFSVFI